MDADRVETILDRKKNEWRSIKVIGENNFVEMWSDAIIRNRWTAKPEIGIATFQHVDAKIQCDRTNAEFYLPHENDWVKWFILPIERKERNFIYKCLVVLTLEH